MWSKEGFRENKGVPLGSFGAFFHQSVYEDQHFQHGLPKPKHQAPFWHPAEILTQAKGFSKGAEDSQGAGICLRPTNLGELSGSGHALVPGGQTQALSTTEDLRPAGSPTLSLGMLASSLHRVVFLCFGY